MLSKDLLQDYQYLINGHAKNNNPRSSTPLYKSRKTTNDAGIIPLVTINDLDKEYYTNGLPIPQKMVTIGGSDDYKLIDAPNIDWNKTYLFWAEQAKAKGIWNNSPEQNEGRDIRSSFYPDYIWPSCEGTSTRVESYPQWADTGLIQNSDDVLDILNYLLWRVLSLDYFADNWDNINTQFPEYTRLSWGTSLNWWYEQINASDLQEALKTPFLQELSSKYGSMPSGNDFTYLLDPDKTIQEGDYINKINIGTLNVSVNDIMNSISENRDEYINVISKIANEHYNDLKFGILTNHPGNFKSVWLKVNNKELSSSLENPCVKFLPGGDIHIAEDGSYELGYVELLNENLETVRLNTFVYSLITDGKFNDVGTLEEFNQNKINVLANKNLPKSKLDGGSNLTAEQKELFKYLDYCPNGVGEGVTVTLSFEQEASTTDPAHKFARKEEDPFLQFKLRKVSNSVTTLNLVDEQTGEAWERTEPLFVPFRHTEDDKYEIIINYPEEDNEIYRKYGLDNSSTYGIYPHFVVKGQQGENISNNTYVDYLKDCLNNINSDNGQLEGTFIHKAQSSSGVNYSNFNYGNVIYENGKYYYVPPRAEDYPDLLSDMTVYIYCLLYYKDNNMPRYINPCTLSLTVLVRPDVENKIVFYDGKETIYSWDNNLQRRIPSLITKHSNWINDSTTYYTNHYTKQTTANITKIFSDNDNDYTLIDSLYTFYRKNEDNEYVETSAQLVKDTYLDSVDYYLEDNLHKDKITDYSYSVKTIKLSWSSYKEYSEEEYTNSLNEVIDESRYVFSNLCVGNFGGYTGKSSFSETIARSLFTQNVHVDFLGLIPSNLIETRETDLGEDSNFESLQYNSETRLNTNETIYYENEYLNGYYESRKNQDDLYTSSNINNVHLNLPQHESDLLNLISSFGVEPTETSETNGNKKFTVNTSEYINSLQYTDGTTIPNTGLKVLDNTFINSPENAVSRILRTNLFNIKYTHDVYNVDTEKVIRYELEFRRSTAMFPYENGLFRGKNSSGSNVIYNADSDYYYLVFKVSCPAGSNFGAAYKECHAYYFLRILRAPKDDNNIAPLIQFIQTEGLDYSLSTNYIHYTAKHGDEDKTYSFFPLVETPIYLNRCLTENAIGQNQRFKGKQWWFLSGLRNEGSSGSWAQNEISSDCFSICNIGDTYYRTSPDFSLSHANWNYSRYLFPEHGMDIRPTQDSKLSGVTYMEGKILNIGEKETIAGKECEMSGPFIYAHTLKKIDNNSHDVVPVAIPKVEIRLGLMYGNDEYTSRKISTTDSVLNVYKKDYDFTVGTYKYELNEDQTAFVKKLVHITPTLDSPNYVKIFKYRKQFNGANQIDAGSSRVIITGNCLWNMYRNQFFLLSNEFGGFKITHTPEEGEDFEQETQNDTALAAETDIFSLYTKFSVAGSTPTEVGQLTDIDRVEFREFSDSDIKLLFNDPNTPAGEDTSEESENISIQYFDVLDNDYTPVVIFASSDTNKTDNNYGKFFLISLNNDNTTYINTYLNIHFNYSLDGKYNGKDLYIKFELAEPSEVELPSSSAHITQGD